MKNLNRKLNYALYILLVVFIFCGCQKTNDKEQWEKVETTNFNDCEVTEGNAIQILMVDSCEYIWCKNGYGAGLTHKGNCKFCIERSKLNKVK